MKQTSMYATGANPTLVQNDEHVLVKGHRPGRGIVGAPEWEGGMGCDTVPAFGGNSVEYLCWRGVVTCR